MLRHVHSRCGDYLCIFKSELSHDQLGVPEVGLELPSTCGPSDNSIEYLAFSQLWLAILRGSLAYSLRLDVISLGEGFFEPVKRLRLTRTAVVISVDKGPHVFDRVMEYRGMASPSHKAQAGEVAAEGVLPVDRGIAGPV